MDIACCHDFKTVCLVVLLLCCYHKETQNSITITLHHHTHHQTIDQSLHVISCRLLGGCVVDVEVTFLTRVVGNKPQLQDIAHMRFSVPAVEGVLLRRGKACCKKRSQGLFLILTPTHDSAARRKPSKSHQQSH